MPLSFIHNFSMPAQWERVATFWQKKKLSQNGNPIVWSCVRLKVEKCVFKNNGFLKKKMLLESYQFAVAISFMSENEF